MTKEIKQADIGRAANSPAGDISNTAKPDFDPDKYIHHVSIERFAKFGAPEDQLEDIRQELRLALQKALAHYNPARSKFNTFVRMVVDRAAVSILRGRSAEASRGIVSLDNPCLDAEDRAYVDALEAPDASPETRDIVIDVREAVSRLPEDERRWTESFMAGASLNEIAAASGLASSTFKYRWNRVLGKLKDFLKNPA